MVYTSTVPYFTDDSLFAHGMYRFADTGAALAETHACIAPENPMYTRAHTVFSQRYYAYPAPPVFMGVSDIAVPEEPVYALRLLIRLPGSDFCVPERLRFLDGFIRRMSAYQAAYFPAYEDRFVYATVRSGPVRTSRDDEFHGDGFQGISVPRHIPEQNYLWACSHPTLFSLQPYFIEHLDPAVHNIHTRLHRDTDMRNVYVGQEKGVYLIDPYHVHARQKLAAGLSRCVVRLTFSPVEIRDDSNTVNPLLPRGPYNRKDIRDALVDCTDAAPWNDIGLTPVVRGI